MQIAGLWIIDISRNPSTRGYHGLGEEKLTSNALYIIGQLGTWLKGGKSEDDLKRFYLALGRQRKREAIAVEEIASALSILKKHIFRYTSMNDVWQRPVEMYRVLELGERLVYFFDRAVYYTLTGYSE